MSLPAVLITGGGTRIGAEIARRFAEAGWHVVIHYRSSQDEAKALSRELPSAHLVQCDLAEGEAAVAMVERLAGELEDWRCLVNSASVFRHDEWSAIDPGRFREAMEVNALSPARMAQTYLQHARSADRRCVIQMSDMKIANPNPDFFSYSMSKHALAATVAMLGKALRNSRDRVYGIAPGAILASHDQSEAEAEISHRLNLLERRTEAREIADAALFLAKGALRSGTTLFVDSGQHLLDQDRDVIWLARERLQGSA